MCISAAVDLLTKRTDSAAAFAQERLNAVWDLVFTLPVYRDLNMDKEVNYHTFQRLICPLMVVGIDRNQLYRTNTSIRSQLEAPTRLAPRPGLRG